MGRADKDFYSPEKSGGLFPDFFCLPSSKRNGGHLRWKKYGGNDPLNEGLQRIIIRSMERLYENLYILICVKTAVIISAKTAREPAVQTAPFPYTQFKGCIHASQLHRKGVFLCISAEKSVKGRITEPSHLRVKCINSVDGIR